MKSTKIRAILILVIGIVVLFFVGVFIYLSGILQHTSTKRLEDKSTKEYPVVISDQDQDGDGIDDQTDLLQGAFNYSIIAMDFKCGR